MLLKIGDKAPNFSLDSESTAKLTLDDFQGQNLLLYFYPKDSTPGCTIQARGFSNHITDFNALNTVVVGISKDSIESHKKFSEKYALKVILASDPEGLTCKSYGALKEKSLFGKKYMGIERSSFLINSDGVIVHIWRKVSIAGHVHDVLTQIKEKLCK